MSKLTTGRIVGVLTLRIALLCALVHACHSVVPEEVTLLAAVVLGVLMPEVMKDTDTVVVD